MEDKEKLQLIMDRFVHPNSPFCQQKVYTEDYVTGTGKKISAGTYYFPVRKGQCNHTPKHERQRECNGFREIPFTNKDLLHHLNGKATYAPYQISKEGTVKWVCFDVDAYEADDEKIQERVVELVRRVQSMVGPHHALVEHSGSKGYHVWVFFDRPISAAHGFAFGHTVVNKLQNEGSLIVEVYPKQQSSTTLGNTVKIPLGIHQKTGARCMFVNSRFEVREDQWGALRDVQPVSADWIEKNIKPTYEEEESESKERGKLLYVPLCLAEILNGGASEGIRDEAAFRIAGYLRDKGLNQHYAMMVLEDWNSRNEPPLEDEELRVKVDSAYEKSYPWRPCLIPGFDPHCQSSCYLFDGKVQQRWFADDKEKAIGQISRE